MNKVNATTCDYRGDNIFLKQRAIEGVITYDLQENLQLLDSSPNLIIINSNNGFNLILPNAQGLILGWKIRILNKTMDNLLLKYYDDTDFLIINSNSMIEIILTENLNSNGIWKQLTVGASSSWGNIGGIITTQTDLINIIGTNSYYAICNESKGSIPKYITIDPLILNNLKTGSKLAIKFINGVNTTNGKFVLTINEEKVCYCYVNGKINDSLSNKENIYIKEGEIVEFTIIDDSNVLILVCNNVVVTSGENYKIYRDGTCEQWGNALRSNSTVNLPIQMYDTHYNIQMTATRQSSGSSGFQCVVLTNYTLTTSFRFNIGSEFDSVYWKVTGYANCENI